MEISENDKRELLSAGYNKKDLSQKRVFARKIKEYLQKESYINNIVRDRLLIGVDEFVKDLDEQQIALHYISRLETKKSDLLTDRDLQVIKGYKAEISKIKYLQNEENPIYDEQGVDIRTYSWLESKLVDKLWEMSEGVFDNAIVSLITKQTLINYSIDDNNGAIDMNDIRKIIECEQEMGSM